MKIADDEDFKRLKNMVENQDGWFLEFDKGVRVWTKQAGSCTFKMVKVYFSQVPPHVTTLLYVQIWIIKTNYVCHVVAGPASFINHSSMIPN